MTHSSLELLNQNGASRLAYRISELAHATGLSDWFVRQEIQRGNLKARKIRSALLVLHDDAVIWLNSYPLVIEKTLR